MIYHKIAERFYGKLRLTARDRVEMPEDMAFQERADLPSEYWDLVHHGIGTYF